MVFSCKAGIGKGWESPHGCEGAGVGLRTPLSPALSSGGLWVGAALTVGSVPRRGSFSPVVLDGMLPSLVACVHKVWGRRQHKDDFRF